MSSLGSPFFQEGGESASAYSGSLYDQSVESVLPQLPGYRSNRHAIANRNQTLKYNSKQMFLTEARNAPRYAQRDMVVSNSATSLTLRSGKSQQPTNGENTFGIESPLTRSNQVLCFNAYFKEAVHDSHLENYRVRSCEIFYYLEDDSMQIVEPKQENSGVPQGNFMKRHRVPRSEDDYFSLDDLAIGESIVLYGRCFHVNGCNESTRQYLFRLRGMPSENELPPVDRYETDRRELMSRETGKDPRVSHNIQKNPMKNFAEAALGNTVDNSGREGFLKYGTSVLRFFCYWDDSESLYGDVQMFKIHYFLYDNTTEVLTVHSANSGRDRAPKLLKRAKLPKPNGGHYHWSDLRVGETVTAYARAMRVVDADVSTRAFYVKEGQPQPARLHSPQRASHSASLDNNESSQTREEQAPVRLAPPSTGFGSEEDSLTSCTGSLVQKAPTKVLGEEGLLRYEAVFARPKPEDRGRVFVVVYDLAENALMIREPPVRNSGVMGGNFLAKSKLKHPKTGAPVMAHDLFVGATIDLAAHTFTIRNADEATLKFMEQRPKQFKLADPHLVELALRDSASHTWPHKDERHDAIRELSPAPRLLTFDQFEHLTRTFQPDQDHGGLPKHALLTFWRNRNQDGKLDLQHLLDL